MGGIMDTLKKHKQTDDGVGDFQADTRVITSFQPFSNSLEHLSALEKEAMCMILHAHAQKNHKVGISNVLSMDSQGDIEHSKALLDKCKAENCSREQASIDAGIHLPYIKFFQEHTLNQFECNAVLLLLMYAFSLSFRDLFRKCGFTGGDTNTIEVRTLLQICCSDLESQVNNLSSFSMDSTLIRDGIITFVGQRNSLMAIMDEDVRLSERVCNILLGKSFQYHPIVKHIRRERSLVRLEQVILPQGLKKNIVSRIENFYNSQQSESASDLENFYGYGSGLAILLRGASGTGKTMLARALANHFNRELFLISDDDFVDVPGGINKNIDRVFDAAAQSEAMVFIDEIDDLLEENPRFNRVLLTEMEKARCVILIATNKVNELDPALERRLSIRASFDMPDASTRLLLWNVLKPDHIQLSEDVDLEALAEKYTFSGGLIKNCWIDAVNAAVIESEEGKPVVTQQHLFNAIDLQSVKLTDESDICETYPAVHEIEDLALPPEQKNSLSNLGQVWDRLRTTGLGFNIIISTPSIETGQKAANAIAKTCGLWIREFDYDQILYASKEDRVLDPHTQKLIFPIEYAFMESTGHDAMILFTDYFGRFSRDINDLNSPMNKGSDQASLLSCLRTNKKLFCLVTKSEPMGHQAFEFNLHLHLSFPTVDYQLSCWMENLGEGYSDEDLLELIHRWPMHAEEIAFMTRQTMILCIISGTSEKPALRDIEKTIKRYRNVVNAQPLFGNIK
jgi:hypothetical protein